MQVMSPWLATLVIGAYLYSLSMEASVRPKLEELADAVTATTQERTQSIAQGLFMTLDSVRVVAERVKALSMCKWGLLIYVHVIFADRALFKVLTFLARVQLQRGMENAIH